MHIHRHCAEAVAKSKTLEIVEFKEYMAIASRFRPIDEEVSSSEVEE